MPSVWDQYPVYTPPAGGQGGVEGVAGMPVAPGAISGINSDLSGNAYLKQFAPEIQQGVHDYIAGRTMPTGNPRRSSMIKTVAGKFGQDIGMPADDTTFGERRTLINELAKGSPQSMGGQLRNGTTAMEHLAKAADAAANLGNWNTGFTPLNEVINGVRGLTSDQSALVKAMNTATGHYGEEITKFYSGSPGASEQRERFNKAMSGTQSPAELAAVLEMEASLIPAKMSQIHDEVKTKLGPYATDKEINEKIRQQQEYKKTIDNAILRLRGRSVEGAAAPASTPQAAPLAPAVTPGPAGADNPALGFPEGSMAQNPKTGEKLIFKGGQWRPM